MYFSLFSFLVYMKVPTAEIFTSFSLRQLPVDGKQIRIFFLGQKAGLNFEWQEFPDEFTSVLDCIVIFFRLNFHLNTHSNMFF